MREKNQIKKYKNNNELDLEKIIDEYSRYVYKIIKNMAILSDEDTEEIISDTFFILWKNKEKLNEEKLLSSYIVMPSFLQPFFGIIFATGTPLKFIELLIITV